MKHEYPQPFTRNYESLLKRLKCPGRGPGRLNHTATVCAEPPRILTIRSMA